ncbi:MAG: dihydroorotase [Dehalococcoidia bacterium]|jgi:dihydroorotase
MISKSILIKNARIIDPSQGIDEKMDILIEDGLIKSSGANLKAPAAVIIQADGLVACPGFIDLHCHLREPGFEEKETIASGAAAAIRGGYTTVCCMPNTNPPLDNAATVDFVRKTAASQAPLITVLPVGCITKGRAGKELTDMSELADAGCAGFSDDGSPVSNSQLMLLAMRCAAGLEIPIIDHCEDLDLSRGGHLHDGWVAARLGIKGIPAAAEETMVARDIALAEMTGAILHLTHISTRGSVDIIRSARARGLKISADVTPHHLTLTEERIIASPAEPDVPLIYDTNAKVNPPLRTAADIEALIQGINDKTITSVSTDHAPHASEDKLCEFELAAFGISGFETAFAALMTLVHSGKIKLNTLIALLTCGPASVLQHEYGITGTLKAGSRADVALLDISREWTLDEANMLSQGKNTPFKGQQFKGMVAGTIHAGEIAYIDKSVRISK